MCVRPALPAVQLSDQHLPSYGRWGSLSAVCEEETRGTHNTGKQQCFSFPPLPFPAPPSFPLFWEVRKPLRGRGPERGPSDRPRFPSLPLRCVPYPTGGHRRGTGRLQPTADTSFPAAASSHPSPQPSHSGPHTGDTVRASLVGEAEGGDTDQR